MPIGISVSFLFLLAIDIYKQLRRSCHLSEKTDIFHHNKPVIHKHRPFLKKALTFLNETSRNFNKVKVCVK